MKIIGPSISLFRVTYTLLTSSLVLNALTLRYSKDQKIIDRAKKKIGSSLVTILPKLGPAFVKLGQTLATRPDLIGNTVSKELESLQDRIPPCDFSNIKAIIDSSIGLKQLKSVNPEAIAAASVAQVYKAETINGEFLALKILRPGIEISFANNLALLEMIAHIMNKLFDVKRLRLNEVVHTIRKISHTELNLMMEAASADQIRENLKKDPNIKIPKVFWEYTSRNILALEWLDGIPIYNKDQLITAGFNLQAITKSLALTFFHQAYVDGFFHADLHQGNILINNLGQIVLLDFGIMGTLDYQNKIFVAEILKSFVDRDYKRVADLHFAAKYVPGEQSTEMFALACRSIGEKILNKPLEDISVSQLLGNLFEITKRFEMETQPQLLLLQKTIVNLEGLSLLLDNQVNMWTVIRPWIQKWAKRNLGAKRIIMQTKNSCNEIIKKAASMLNSLEILINKKL